MFIPIPCEHCMEYNMRSLVLFGTSANTLLFKILFHSYIFPFLLRPHQVCLDWEHLRPNAPRPFQQYRCLTLCGSTLSAFPSSSGSPTNQSYTWWLMVRSTGSMLNKGAKILLANCQRLLVSSLCARVCNLCIARSGEYNPTTMWHSVEEWAVSSSSTASLPTLQSSRPVQSAAIYCGVEYRRFCSSGFRYLR